MRSKIVRINANSHEVKIFKDPSYSENYPWVVEINGAVANNGADRADAIDLAQNWLIHFETNRIRDEINRHMKYTFLQGKRS